MRRRLLALLVAPLVALLAAPGGLPLADASRAADPRRPDQYALEALRLPPAWARTRGADTVIAVVDTGVDLDHPDLVDHLLPGADLVDGDGEPDDPNGHGTHVAGLAAAVGGNDEGIIGAAPEARLLPVRVLRADGSGSARTIADGVAWAVAHGARVVNLSLGGSGLAPALFRNGPLNRAVRDAANRGVLVVVAAGNDAATETAYRPTVPVLVVNASDAAAAPAPFTTWGDPVAVAAPGVDVVSTAPPGPTTRWPTGTDGYAAMDGTSMSAGLVSGVAALLLAQGLSADEARDVLVTTARNPGDDPRLGAGVVDADAAVTEASLRHPLPLDDADEATGGRFAAWLAPLVVVGAAVVLPAAALALVRRRARARP
ncbi:MAG: S8 family serine peptidase [Acidimicrobiales bacterium]|nr:S8 family serine peptidase [Acidimicrobiales bacterium]MCB9372908.1 S8 family serine peptidase [Microthrixaceae bacterium]